MIILIESTDLIFAVDSIPAAFAITRNEFVIYTSNIFVIMGLRAMFFLLAKGLSVVLIFVGIKMLLEWSLVQDGLHWLSGTEHVHISIFLSFGIIIGALTLAIVLSLMFPRKPELVESEDAG